MGKIISHQQSNFVFHTMKKDLNSYILLLDFLYSHPLSFTSQQLKQALQKFTYIQLFRFQKEISKLMITLLTNNTDLVISSDFLSWFKGLVLSHQKNPVNKSLLYFGSFIRMMERKLKQKILERQWEIKMNQVKEVNPINKLIKNKLTNDRYLFQESIRCPEISGEQVSKIIKDVNENVDQNKFKLTNPQCIKCNTFYEKGAKVRNQNKFWTRVHGIPAEQMLNIKILQKLICALANEGPSVLIIGIRDEVVQGIPYQVQVEQKLLNFITQIRTKINPQIYILPERVSVEKKLGALNNRGRKDLYVWRIAVLPLYPYLQHQLRISDRISPQSQQTYIFQERDSSNIISLKQDKIYTLMHKKHNEFKQKIQQLQQQKKKEKQRQYKRIKPFFINSHYESCRIPPLKKQQKSQIQPEDKEESIKEISKCLLVINSGHASQIQKQLKEKFKSQIQIEIPFQKELQHNKVDTIQLNYKKEYQQMVKDLKKIMNEIKVMKKNIIRLIPIKNSLQVSQADMDSFRPQFIENMERKYGKSGQNRFKMIIGVTQVEKYEFDREQMAIYGYILLMHNNVRAYLVKKGQWNVEI